MTNMYLTSKCENLKDAVKSYKKDWGELWEEKEAFKRQYFHDEDLIIMLSDENKQLKKKIEELEGKKHNSKPKKVKKD